MNLLPVLEGMLFIVGEEGLTSERIKEVLEINDEELESLLLLIPEIREVVVTPISDEMVQYIPRYHISLYDTNIDYKELEEKINALVMSKLNENWLPGSIAYYDKPLERMQNSKVKKTMK